MLACLLVVGAILLVALVVWLATGPQRRYFEGIRPRRRIFDWEHNKQGFVLGVLAIVFIIVALSCMGLSLLGH